LDIILQFYGLSFILLGMIVFIWPKQQNNYYFTQSIWLFGTFALTHGLVEWMDLWRNIHGDTPLLDIFTPFLLLFSLLFLFEFGRRLTQAVFLPETTSKLLAAALSPWVYLPILGLIILQSITSAQPMLNLTILSRYLVGFSGSLLTGIGIFGYWNQHIKPQQQDDEKTHLSTAFNSLGIAFIFYGPLTGLIVPVANWFPASLLNDTLFQNTFHFPVEIAKSACAIIAAFSTAYILRAFEIKSHRQMVTAQASFEDSKEALKRASQKSELLLRTAGDGIHVLDLDGNVLEANDAFCHMLGYTREEVLGMNVNQWDAYFSADELKARIPDLLDKRSIFETLHKRRDGSIIDVEISTVGVEIDGQTMLYCSSRDITDRKHAEEQMRLVARVFDRAAEGVLITDANQNILTVNNTFTSVTGYSRDEVIGKTPTILRSEKQSRGFYKNMWDELNNNGWWQGEIWNRRKNGELYLEWLSINAIKDDEGKVVNYIGMFSDITLIKDSRMRIEYLATHDELTGLPNRALFNDHLKLSLARSARTGMKLGLLFVDLDNFKMINDTLGHEEGDDLLKQVAERLKHCARETDTVSRLGGDEFVILMEIDHWKDAEIMARRILDEFATSFLLQEQSYTISSSIGISLFPSDALDPRVLMRHADTAMYKAKEQGKNTYAFFTDDMAKQISRRMNIENALRQAIRNEDLFLEYQPQINLADNTVTGMEALLRWRHEDKIISPNDFIPVAEESTLIVEIDEWVIRQACRQLGEWNQANLTIPSLSINISARHFRQRDAIDRIIGIVMGRAVSPAKFCLEITEGVLMDMESSQNILKQLTKAGFRVSVDDFGTGFSSLSYIKKLPIHEIKVDRSFVDGVENDQDDRAITTAIISMAKSMGLKTVAEGIESEEHHAILKSLGCDIGQGNYYSKPMTALQLDKWLREHKTVYSK
jgi:two-component system CheB/CheR fusion protein